MHCHVHWWILANLGVNCVDSTWWWLEATYLDTRSWKKKKGKSNSFIVFCKQDRSVVVWMIKLIFVAINESLGAEEEDTSGHQWLHRAKLLFLWKLSCFVLKYCDLVLFWNLTLRCYWQQFAFVRAAVCVCKSSASQCCRGRSSSICHPPGEWQQGLWNSTLLCRMNGWN